MRLASCCIALIFFLVDPAWGATAPACLRIASVGEAPEDDFGLALGKALYDEAGLCATIVGLPTERSRRMLDAHELDGVVARTRDFILHQPRLIAVPTPLASAVGRLYWRSDRPKPKYGSQTVGFPRGWVWPHLVAQSLGLKPVEVDDNASLLKMTETGRIDACLMADYEFAVFADSEEERRMFASADVVPIRLYHAVTLEHADLMPLLDAAIRRLEARGEIARLIREHPAH